MRHARVAYAGAIHDAVEHPAGLRLEDGRVLAESAVVWLPPFEVGTIVALGLNYADHRKELAHELTATSLGLLAGLVLVRTFLSWTLVLEIEGRWPWQREPSPMSSRSHPGGVVDAH